MNVFPHLTLNYRDSESMISVLNISLSRVQELKIH
jgi:hypothetical protein